MIWITGDYHAGTEAQKLESENFPAGRALSRDDYLIIAGDLGLPWSASEREVLAMGALAAAPWTTLFIDGNHERFDYLEGLPVEEWHGGKVQRVWTRWTLPDPATCEPIEDPAPVYHLMRGQVYDIDGARIFTMGGATSIDRAYREEGTSWFPQELPSKEEYAEAERNLDQAGWQVDYVVTHCCSTSMVRRVVYPDPRWQRMLTDELTEWLDTLEGRLGFKRWYFGHHHYTRDADERHTLLYNAVLPLGMSVGEARAKGALHGFPEERGYASRESIEHV